MSSGGSARSADALEQSPRQKNVAVSVDDYAVAAINLYVDIIQLFMFLLELFGDRGRR